jgi:hypothetical protein
MVVLVVLLVYVVFIGGADMQQLNFSRQDLHVTFSALLTVMDLPLSCQQPDNSLFVLLVLMSTNTSGWLWTQWSSSSGAVRCTYCFDLDDPCSWPVGL